MLLCSKILWVRNLHREQQEWIISALWNLGPYLRNSNSSGWCEKLGTESSGGFFTLCLVPGLGRLECWVQLRLPTRCLRGASPSGLGFSQPISWVPKNGTLEENIQGVTVPREPSRSYVPFYDLKSLITSLSLLFCGPKQSLTITHRFKGRKHGLHLSVEGVAKKLSHFSGKSQTFHAATSSQTCPLKQGT